MSAQSNDGERRWVPHTRKQQRIAVQQPRWELRLLGGFAVLADGRAVPERAWGGSRKARTWLQQQALADPADGAMEVASEPSRSPPAATSQ